MNGTEARPIRWFVLVITDKAASCRDIEEVLALGPVNVARFSTLAHSFAARGYTPITEALRRAAVSLPDVLALPVHGNTRRSIDRCTRPRQTGSLGPA